MKTIIQLFFFIEFWLLSDKLIVLNETVTELSLNLEVGPISMIEGEADELKVCYSLNL